MPKSLYIHIPFCRNKCPYCDFYSIAYQKELAQRYIKILCKQIEKSDTDFETIYIGGGTPSILDIQLWQKLLTSLKKVSRGCREFNLEVNPESLDGAKLDLFLKMGVNRMSIGLQSLDEQKLKKIGRIHSASQAVKKVQETKVRGFNNLSVDLIFGVWGESLEKWHEELKEVVRLPVDHISLYGLTYEKNTELSRRVNNQEIRPLADQVVVQMYRDSVDYLAQQGFLRYEVSNFSKPGYECKHNLNYWDNNYYQGLGASAASYFEGIRQKNVCDVSGYIQRVKKREAVVDSSEKLSSEARAKETAAIKIRTRAGIDFNWFKVKTGFDFLTLEDEVLAELKGEGLVAYRDKAGKPKAVFLTDKGFLFADRVSSAFL